MRASLRRALYGLASLPVFLSGLLLSTSCSDSSGGGGPRTPDVNVPTNLAVGVGGRLEFKVTATDFDGTALTAMLEPLPLMRNLRFDPEAGLAVFTPDPQQAGVVGLEVVATGAEATARKQLVITISERPAGSDTQISGVVLDSDTQEPIVGAEVRLPGTTQEVVTDASGAFKIGPVDATQTVIDIDGVPAGGWTFVAEDIELLLGHPLYDGQDNAVHRPIYLPKLGPSAGVVDPQQNSMLQNDQGVTVMVAANSARAPDGSMFAGDMYLPRVQRDFTPAALPDTLEPADVFAIQPAGLTFNPPAQLTLPNSNGLPDGSEVQIWSIDPMTGDFHVVGTAVASGSDLVTTTGGIRNSSWHFAEPGGPDGDDDDNPDKNDDPNNCTQQGASAVTLHTGNLSEEHPLLRYRSQGQERGLTLVHVGRSSCPTPVISSDLTLHRRFASPRAFSSTLELGGLTVPGELFFEAPSTDDRSPQRLARMFDATLLPTGYYPYTLKVTSHYAQSRVSTNLNGGVIVHNNMQSPFGCGWSLKEVDRLHAQRSDGNVVVEEGDGSVLVFRPSAGDLDYPDFGSLTNLALNGDAGRIANPVVVDGRPVLRLNQSSGAGSAFYNQSVPLVVDGVESSFQVEFAVRMSDPAGIRDADGSGADGMVFVLANRSGALGSGGQGIGYQGIGPSVGVELDTYFNSGSDPNGNHVGINVGGNIRSIASQPYPQRFNDGDDWYGWIDYDATTDTLEVRISDRDRRPTAPTLSATVDVLAALGQNEAYAGFTAGAASATNKHDVLFWRMSWGDQSPTTEQSYLGPRGDFSRLTRLPDGSYRRSFLDGRSIGFDAAGRQTEHADRNDNVTRFGYDGQGRLTDVTDPIGLVTRLAYRADGLLDSITHPGGEQTRFEHSNRDLVGITDPDQARREFRYDAQHRLVGQTDQRGFATTYSYTAGSVLQGVRWEASQDQRSYRIARLAGVRLDVSGSSLATPDPIQRTAEIGRTVLTDARGKPVEVETDPMGHLVFQQDALGNSRSMQRNVNGLVERAVSPRGRVDTMRYDAQGNLLELIEGVGSAVQRRTLYTYVAGTDRVRTVTNGEGHTTTFDYDDAGNLLRVVHPDAAERSYTYDDRGLVTRSIDENGNQTRYEYDGQGRLEVRTDALGHVTRYAYDERGNALSIVEGEGMPEQRLRRFTYDDRDRVVTSTDGAGGTTTFHYDEAGNLLRTVLPTGEAIVRSYDSRGRLASLLDPLRGETTFAYDGEGNLRTRTDARSLVTSYDYDDAGRLVEVLDPAGGVERYEYDASGNVARFVNAREKATTFGHDLLERRELMRTPMGRTRRWAYDRTDNLVTETQPDGLSIRHRYDDRGRRIRTDVPSAGGVPGNAITFDYDAAGNLRLVTDNDTRLERTYDPLDRVREEKTLAGGIQPVSTLTSSYNAVGDRVRLADSFGGVHTYGHDGAGRMTSVSTPVIGTVSMAYDRSGRLTRIGYPNGITGTYSYLPSGRLQRIRHARADGSALLDLQYTTGASGNIDSITDGGVAKNYGYDPLDRLTDASDIAPAAYAYDPVGNRLQSDSTSTAVYNDDNQLVSDDTATYAYDARGNLTAINEVGGASRTFRWDAQNQLVEAVGAGTYRYDGLGRRVERATSAGETRRFIIDREEVLLEVDVQGSLHARYSHTDRVDSSAAMERLGSAFYFHVDHLSSVRLLTDRSGAARNRYDYDAYGRSTSRSEAVENPIQYTGRERDSETGLYYYRARYYDPMRGVFTGEDPIRFRSGDPNWYRYASSRPTVLRDPGGLEASDADLPSRGPVPMPLPTPEPDKTPSRHRDRNRNNRCPQRMPGSLDNACPALEERGRYNDRKNNPWIYEGTPSLHGNNRTFRGTGDNAGSQCTYGLDDQLINDGRFQGTYDYYPPFNDDGTTNYWNLPGHFFQDVVPHFFDDGYTNTPDGNIY